MDIAVGDSVSLTFNYDDLSLSKGTGTVQMISDVSVTTDTSDVSYEVYIDFTADENTRLGMTVMVDILGEDGQAEAVLNENGQAAADEGTAGIEGAEQTVDAGDFMIAPAP